MIALRNEGPEDRDGDRDTDMLDVTSCVDEGGAACVIHDLYGMVPAEHALTPAVPSVRVRDQARLDALLDQIRADVEAQGYTVDELLERERGR